MGIKLKNQMIFISLIAVFGALTGCHSKPLLESMTLGITPYRAAVVQGNFVSQEAAAKVRIGMTREAVRNILGTPLLIDPFHPNRWDYVFYFKRGQTDIVTQRHFIVHFNKERVAAYSGAEDLPSEYDLIQAVDGDRKK